MFYVNWTSCKPLSSLRSGFYYFPHCTHTERKAPRGEVSLPSEKEGGKPGSLMTLEPHISSAAELWPFHIREPSASKTFKPCCVEFLMPTANSNSLLTGKISNMVKSFTANWIEGLFKTLRSWTIIPPGTLSLPPVPGSFQQTLLGLLWKYWTEPKCSTIRTGKIVTSRTFTTAAIVGPLLG